MPPILKEGVRNYTYVVRNSFPHDSQAFTQGLAFDNGILYEGTGLNGRSSLRRVALETGEVLQNIDLGSQYFGEGVEVVGDRIVQLTWTSRTGFMYDRSSFALQGQFSYTTQGWGITFDGSRFIMSDGSEKLYFLDADSFALLSSVQVKDNSRSVRNLNELEFIQGFVFANVWMENDIVVINPADGQVVARLDLTGLLSSEEAQVANVLNGIAFDEENGRLFVTGKLWPKLFDIELVPKTD